MIEEEDEEEEEAGAGPGVEAMAEALEDELLDWMAGEAAPAGEDGEDASDRGGSYIRLVCVRGGESA